MAVATRFRFVPFSKKQKQVLTWWLHPKLKNKDAIIADGAIRSGKTLITSLSFVIWSMHSFNQKSFGLSGKTVGSFKRNVWLQLKTMLLLRGYKVKKQRDTSDNAYVISKGKIQNQYYIFGGRDERSQDLVQGFTAAGFLFDEVALMPKTFVMQAIGRCSEEGAKLWFNCNPDNPYHWFYLEWIKKLKEQNAIYLHFDLDDNPSLTESTKEKYRRRFTGIFYQRFILGLWVLAEGIIYSMFKESMIIDEIPAGVKILKHWVSIDYGQSNATVFLHEGLGTDNKLYIIDEYFHEGRSSSIQKSPLTYSKEYFAWLKKIGPTEIIHGQKVKYPLRKEATFIDPSAEGFILQLFEDGERDIKNADNKVMRGIELISSLLDHDVIRVLKRCENTVKEFSSYRWDPKAQERGEDKPIKDNDHCMDAFRYMVNSTRKIWQRILITQPKQ